MKTTAVTISQDEFGRRTVIPVFVNEDNSLEQKNELLKAENEQLKTSLEYEKKIRVSLEKENTELKEKIEYLKNNPPKRTRRTKQEMENDIKEYSMYKVNGCKKAQPAEPIRSYDDFKAIQDYFLKQNNVRDWMLWTLGVSLGLRISDLLKLKVKDIFNPDMTFRDRIMVVEQKTSKLNNCLITESVRYAIKKYFDTLDWKVDYNNYLFISHKTKSKMREEYGWKLISDAGKSLNLPINIGSHTMRKTFANIAACVDKSSVDMNTITKIQGLLNHSDQRVTMRYLGTFQKMYDNARIAVSDFVLGKTNVNELVAGASHTVDDVFSKLDSLETKFFDKQN